VRFGADGLAPCVAQDAASGEVLMLAYVNREALAATLASGEAHYWSRRRAELWHKGATSGNRQRVLAVHLDCDHDAVLYQVTTDGPACHTGAVACFRDAASDGASAAPGGGTPPAAYVAKLQAKSGG